MKKIKRNLYLAQKIVNINHHLQYVEDENGYLFSDGIYKTKIKPEDLPEWYVHGRYYRCLGYMSAKGVVDLKYIPNMWINHFLKDDFLLVSYNEPIKEIGESNRFWERYAGYDKKIFGNEILYFLKAVQKYSDIDISEIVKQIQEKADILPKKHPDEFGDFKFDVEAYLNKD